MQLCETVESGRDGRDRMMSGRRRRRRDDGDSFGFFFGMINNFRDI